MLLYKLIDRDYYRPGNVIRTKDVNYSTNIKISDAHIAFYEYIFEASDKNGVPIDRFVNMANLLLGAFGLQLPPEQVYLAECQKSERLDKSEFLNFCRICAKHKVRFLEFLDACRMREYLIEKVRKQSFEHAPSRLESYFAFEDPSSIRYYIDNHGAVGVACELDVTGCAIKFPADMSLIDSIEFDTTYSSLEKIVSAYWSQQRSSSPCIEVLLQGVVKLGNVMSTIARS